MCKVIRNDLVTKIVVDLAIVRWVISNKRIDYLGIRRFISGIMKLLHKEFIAKLTFS